MQDSSHPEITANPLTALMQLATVVDTIDSFVASLALEGSAQGGYFRRAAADAETVQHARDLVYLRNSLCVSYELWQNDLRRRLLRSQGDFYIFSMTGDETLSFARHVVPGLTYAAEALRTQCQTWPLLASRVALFDILENIAGTAQLYAHQNKDCLRRALSVLKENGETPGNLPCLQEGMVRPLPLPHLPRQDKAESGHAA